MIAFFTVSMVIYFAISFYRIVVDTSERHEPADNIVVIIGWSFFALQAYTYFWIILPKVWE